MRWAAAVVGAAFALAGCTAATPAPATPSPSLGLTTAAQLAAPTTSEQLCRDQLGEALISWSRGLLSVAALRATTWGPVRRPLATAFAGVPDDTGGAWCGTRLANGTRWWAVVAGQAPLRVVDTVGVKASGPGAGPVIR